MGDMMGLIENVTVLDLTLPGTHDTMTWDLCPVVSDGANDLPAPVADLLHQLGDWGHLGEFARNQSVTQGLNVTQQLDNGVRFLDFRVGGCALARKATHAVAACVTADGPGPRA
jgi:hypothetical protein